MGIRVHVLFRGKGNHMPTLERKKEIEGIVSEIIRKNELNRPGFDLIGFLTKHENFKVAMQKLEKGTTGLLLVNEQEWISNAETHRLIVINNRLDEEPDFYKRRRFITAHEYAHFILHNNGAPIFAHRDDSERESPMEKEADYFARCLLMPRQLIEQVFDLWGMKTASLDEKVSLISEVFNVTKKKAKQRLAEDFV